MTCCCFHIVCWLAGCLLNVPAAGWCISGTDRLNCACCHTEIEVAGETFYFAQSPYTDTGPASPSADPISPGAWQGSRWNANFLSHGCDSTRKNPCGESENRTPDLPLLRRTVFHIDGRDQKCCRTQCEQTASQPAQH